MLQRTRITGVLVLAIAMLAATLALAPLGGYPALDAAASMRALRPLDIRVASVGDRLTTANVLLCRERQYQHGLAIHDLSQFSRASRPAAVSAFGLDRGPAILALASGGAAAKAGLQLDDLLVAADGAPIPRPSRDVHDSFAPTERIIDALEAAFADGAAELDVRRGTDLLRIRVQGAPGCASRFQLVPSGARAAKADGRYVQLTSALVEFTRDDHELAALMAHELAHNILRHRARLNEAQVDWDARKPNPRDARLLQRTEFEADRLAIHLMAGAGYDPAAAVRLWTRQSAAPQNPSNGSHPPWPARIEAMEAEIAALAEAKAAGRAARPPLPLGPLGPRNK